MADIDFGSPFTFRTSSSNFAGSYYYNTVVTPDDPDKYKGPRSITVTSNRLLTENEVLAEASDIALSRSRYQYGGTPLDIEVTRATINMNLVPEI